MEIDGQLAIGLSLLYYRVNSGDYVLLRFSPLSFGSAEVDLSPIAR